VCAAAKVDRNNLSKRHPEIIKLIEQLAEPDRLPPSGKRDRRTRTLEAVNDDRQAVNDGSDE
jgi:hypothetical protein